MDGLIFSVPVECKTHNHLLGLFLLVQLSSQIVDSGNQAPSDWPHLSD